MRITPTIYLAGSGRLGESLLRLAELRVDALFPGHFHFCLRDAQSHIEAAASCLRNLLIPRSIA